MSKVKKSILAYTMCLALVLSSMISFTVPSYADIVADMNPYLCGVTTNSVWVVVECNSTAAVTVDFGRTTSYGSTATTTSTQTTTNSTYVHNIKLTGLSANTTYHYRVKQGASTSLDYTFKTAVNPGTSFRFAFMADFRNGTSVHDAIAPLVKSYNPAFILNGGDIAYDSLYDTMKNEFFRPAELDLLATTPMFLSPGNHEGWSTNTKAFFQGPASAASGDPDYYSFDYGDMHVLMVNNFNYDRVDYREGSAQYNFVKSDLESSSKPWKIVFDHKPAYASGGHNEEPDMKVMTTNLFEPNAVDMVFSGHSHFYQHNLVNNIHHMIVGTVGAPPNTPVDATYTVKSAKKYCFSIIDVTPTTFECTTYDETNTPIETILLTKGGATPTPTPTPSGDSATYIAKNATWKYLDTGVDQGTAWRATSFEDGSWSSGAAQLGFGNKGETTKLTTGNNTYYFRKAFNISNPSSIMSLNLGLKRDDGAVVYLNGTEVARSNMPAGTISYGTYASTTCVAPDETTFFDYSINPSQLVSGTNVIAVEVHQKVETSGDLIFDLELTGTVKTASPTPTPTPTPAPTPSGEEITLISRAAQWRYLDTGIDQGTAWKEISFADTSWPIGLAQLGFGNRGETTTLTQGYNTYYFRKKISIDNPAMYTNLQLSLVRDDGAIVYVNGTEVVRSNMPNGTISYGTYASTTATSTSVPTETEFTTYNIDPSLLVTGTNVIAVEVHQKVETSSDLTFNLGLVANAGTAPTPTPTPSSSGGFRFAVMADSRGVDDGYVNGIDDGTNGAEIEAVLAQMKLVNPQPQFAMVMGDLVGGSTLKVAGEVSAQLQNWRSHVTKYYPIEFFYPMPGNHEIKGSSACEQAFSDAFPEFTANFLSGYYRSAFYFDYGNSRFFAVNSNHYNENHRIIGNQFNWLKSNIDSSKTHNFFFSHEPGWGVWKVANNLDMYTAERDAFWDLVDSTNRPMFFAGHEHTYARKRIDSNINANGYTFDKTVYQITTGGMGAPLTSTYQDATQVEVLPSLALKKYHFLLVDVDGNNVTVTAMAKDGSIIDSFTQTTW